MWMLPKLTIPVDTSTTVVGGITPPISGGGGVPMSQVIDIESPLVKEALNPKMYDEKVQPEV